MPKTTQITTYTEIRTLLGALKEPLEDQEIDYVTLVMYKVTRDVNNLSIEELFKEFGNEEEMISLSKMEESPEFGQSLDSVGQITPILRQAEQLKERELLEKTKGLLTLIASRLKESKIEPEKLFEGVKNESIPLRKFFKRLEQLSIPKLSPKSRQSILKFAGCDDNKSIKLPEFTLLMNAYMEIDKIGKLNEETAEKDEHDETYAKDYSENIKPLLS